MLIMIQSEMIHHISLDVTDLEKSKQFYSEVLCLQEIERPGFLFRGAWYAIGSSGQQLHLIVHPGETLRTRGLDTRDGHFAIRVKDFEETVAWLEKKQVVYKANYKSHSGFPQIFVLDPDSNIIEMNTVN
jgi:glyoxylase I family protein